jgi:hypothetical protein
MSSREPKLARGHRQTRPARLSGLSWRGGIVVGIVAALAVLNTCWTTSASADDAVRILLASASTLTPSEMANQTGSGLSGPAAPAPGGLTSQPRIRLWDELHQVTIPVVQDQSVTFTVRTVP